MPGIDAGEGTKRRVNGEIQPVSGEKQQQRNGHAYGNAEGGNMVSTRWFEPE
ncbi:hypothetical protein ACUY3M_03860 [Corynebacterium suicordis]